MPRQTGHHEKGRPADFKPKDRTCLSLGCGRVFFSMGPGNRKCPKCLARENDAGLSRRELEPTADHTPRQ